MSGPLRSASAVVSFGSTLAVWTATGAGEDPDARAASAAEIALAVAVEIHREFQETAGHELAQPHRPGIGTHGLRGVDAFLPGHDQEVLQLFGEILPPARIIEGQGGEGVDNPVIGAASGQASSAYELHRPEEFSPGP